MAALATSMAVHGPRPRVARRHSNSVLVSAGIFASIQVTLRDTMAGLQGPAVSDSANEKDRNQTGDDAVDCERGGERAGFEMAHQEAH